MSNKMLIDASHQEETRVVVTRGQRIEEFDFESEHKKQIKGNIYLARVTRVEPSLQAAFVEYGGNRHGFLAFSEIHPDYYQIPVADRQALLEAEARGMREQESDVADSKIQNLPTPDEADKPVQAQEEDVSDSTTSHDPAENGNSNSNANSDENMVELVGAEDAMEEVPLHQHDHRRSYKIQEVIKKRQILLVQVVKEERGNKGAALTTYLSLAGRYSVLMPNTARGGGISRKIVNLNDRKRLKEIVKELEVPKGMGVILRTAGANRTRTEIKRDYEYLIRLWENIRNLTLSSIAPALVHEEGNLIKRSIRDLYNKNIDEVLVAGEHAYREAKDFMRMLMPSHAKVVQPYRDPVPIFSRNGIELQLDRMFQPEVTLKSGGYLVMNQTEALVAIDVNSGRATKEHSVEETAVRTNLEAAEEVARQLRLRDLAGLIVIDFIDMAEKRNIRLVEKKLKDCLKDDRARIQVGYISAFGLLEMSRQRLRASVLESTTQICPHCHGTGYIRSPSSIALHVIRGIEEYLLRQNGHDLIVHTPTPTALYVLNQKRRLLSELETRFGLEISFEADDNLGTQHFAIHQGEVKKGEPSPVLASFVQAVEDEEDDSAALALEAEIAAEKAAEAEETREEETKEEEQGNNRHRRDKRRRGARHRGNGVDAGLPEQEKTVVVTEKSFDDEAGEDGRDKKRRRGRRAGRRMRDYNGRGRLPFAEPVGPFAASALAMLRHRKRARYAPKAEPVGPFVAERHVINHHATKPDTIVEITVPVGPENLDKIENAPNTDTITTKKRGRKTKPVLVDDIVNTAAEVKAPLLSPVEDQEATTVKKTRARRTKAEKALNEDIADTRTIQEVVVEEAAKPQRKTRKKIEDVALPVDGAVIDAQEKPKPARTRRKKQTEPVDHIEEQPRAVAFVSELERFPKVKTRFSDKKRDENKELEHISSPSEEKNALAAQVIEELAVAPRLDETVREPVVISSSTEILPKPKRVGWWQRKSFF